MSATVVIDTTSRNAVLELRLYPHGGMSALAGPRAGTRESMLAAAMARRRLRRVISRTIGTSAHSGRREPL